MCIRDRAKRTRLSADDEESWKVFELESNPRPMRSAEPEEEAPPREWLSGPSEAEVMQALATAEPEEEEPPRWTASHEVGGEPLACLFASNKRAAPPARYAPVQPEERVVARKITM